MRLLIREKFLFVEKTNDQKTEEAKPKKTSGEKNVLTKLFRVLMHFVKEALAV